VAGCSAWSPPRVAHHRAGVDSPSSANNTAKIDDAPSPSMVLRSQNDWDTDTRTTNPVTPGSQDHYRYPMTATDASPDAIAEPDSPGSGPVQPAQYMGASDAASLWSSYGQQPSSAGQQPSSADAYQPGPAYPGPSRQMSPPAGTRPLPADAGVGQGPTWPVASPPATQSPATQQPGASPPSGLLPYNYGELPGDSETLPQVPPNAVLPTVPERYADVVVNVQETQTGRIMLGAGVNSDLGVTGQVIIDERNFDWRRFPTSIDDVLNGKAFRGAGQGFRVEAMPGREVQRYMVQFTEPYLAGTRVSLNLSGYLYDRRFYDWDEQRLGARFGMGYRLTPDLSLSAGVRGEQVDLTNPRVLGVPELDSALGESDLYMGQVTLTHDTRDIPFAPTEGHLLELNYSQAFGTYDFPRGEIDYRKYYLLTERTDGSGRHVLGFASRFGFTGSQTPIYENYFAGGHRTLRGFEFREASPKMRGVTVGGEFLMLGSLEYLFPITADDMLKGVLFTDFGTVEENIEINTEDFRVAFGGGLRIFIPAMGPAPIALDFAVPVAREDTDSIENFSFFIGLGR
jgi:outer membrane protein insertion porin family